MAPTRLTRAPLARGGAAAEDPRGALPLRPAGSRRPGPAWILARGADLLSSFMVMKPDPRQRRELPLCVPVELRHGLSACRFSEAMFHDPLLSVLVFTDRC